jgi:creatinine amidohydrolase
MGEIPDALRRTAARPLPALDLGGPRRRVVATGVGSSAAHAALLAHELRRAARDAIAVPLSTFLAPAVPAPDDVLVVFSQGLSPNAMLALAAPAAWRRVVLVTAVADEARLTPLRDAGVAVVPIEGADEFGTLARVIGPMTGGVAALALAAALGGPPLPDIGRVADELPGIAAPRLPDGAFDAGVAFLATGTYGELAANLQYKVLEGMLRPMPPVWDLLHVAHGPFQERWRERTTFVALARPDAPGEEALLDALAAMLDPARHALVRLASPWPSPLALFAHEAMLNALVLRELEARGVDQVRWPGRGADGPLYSIATAPPPVELGALVWPEVAARAPRTAIVPLGATEQHGPHLPYATDTIVADALAVRLAARLPDAVALPALGLGCSREHLGFPGTLDLAPGTLAAVLGDVLASLARHGVREAFVFSAHGGNMAALRAFRDAERPPDVRVAVHTDLDGLTAVLHTEAARAGVPPEHAGHHAGELETSILLALRPELVRGGVLAPGRLVGTAGAQDLFYPSLRAHAPDGTVGDPRGASALRGRRYLAVWVNVLEAAYRDAKKRWYAAGTKAP